jgi:electron transport complex protein RnfG
MKKVAHIVATLTIIGVVAGGLLSLVNNWAAPKIAANQKAEIEKAIFIVQPDGKSYDRMEDPLYEVYRVFNDSSRLIGYSMVCEGNGFQGKIRMMLGLKDDLSKITSFEVLEQSETPGLGTKILEPPFKDQFNNLEINPKIEWVKGKSPGRPNEIQAITGATISSKSVVAIMNEGIAKLKDLQKKGTSL